MIDNLKQGFIDGSKGIVTEDIKRILDGLDALKQLITDVKTGKANWGWYSLLSWVSLPDDYFINIYQQSTATLWGEKNIVVQVRNLNQPGDIQL